MKHKSIVWDLLFIGISLIITSSFVIGLLIYVFKYWKW